MGGSSILDAWYDLVAAELRHGTEELPHIRIVRLLAETLDARASSVRVDAEGRWSLVTPSEDLPPGWPPGPDAQRRFGELLQDFPLVRWLLGTGDLRAATSSRVPEQFAGAAAEMRELVTPHELEEQLAVPVRLEPSGWHTYVLAQPQHDFSDEALALARAIQPLLWLVDRQARVLARREGIPGAAVAVGLTSRERTVLVLLADGLTAGAIARRLGISPRTVTKHVEHVYRKLGAKDRLRAVRSAEAIGVLLPVDPRTGMRGAPPGPETPVLELSGPYRTARA